jgi:hypothetical protein
LHHCCFLVLQTELLLDCCQGFRELSVNRFFDPAVERDLLITLMLVQYPGEEVSLTFGHVSRS